MRIRVVVLLLLLGIVAAGCDARRETAPPSRPAAASPKTDLIDINRASAKELMTLKGIGEVRAAAIIRGRPFARKDELVQQGIVPLPVYEEIKDRIIARQK